MFSAFFPDSFLPYETQLIKMSHRDSFLGMVGVEVEKDV